MNLLLHLHHLHFLNFCDIFAYIDFFFFFLFYFFFFFFFRFFNFFGFLFAITFFSSFLFYNIRDLISIYKTFIESHIILSQIFKSIPYFPEFHEIIIHFLQKFVTTNCFTITYQTNKSSCPCNCHIHSSVVR